MAGQRQSQNQEQAYQEAPDKLCGEECAECYVQIEAPGERLGGRVCAPHIKHHEKEAGKDLKEAEEGPDLWQTRYPSDGSGSPLPGSALHAKSWSGRLTRSLYTIFSPTFVGNRTGPEV